MAGILGTGLTYYHFTDCTAEEKIKAVLRLRQVLQEEFDIAKELIANKAAVEKHIQRSVELQIRETGLRTKLETLFRTDCAKAVRDGDRSMLIREEIHKA